MNHYRIVVITLWLTLVWVGPLHGQDQEEESVSTEQEQPAETDEEASGGEMDEPEAAGAEQPRDRRGVRRLGDVVGSSEDEFSLDVPTINAPQAPEQDQPAVSLPDPELDARLQALLRRRAFNPQDPGIQTELDSLLTEIQADATEAINAEDYDLAARLVGVIAELDPGREGLETVQATLQEQAELGTLLASAEAAMADGRLIEPSDDNALDYYRAALQIEADNSDATSGIANVQQRLLARSVELAEELDFEGATELVDRAAGVQDSPEAVEEARTRIAEIRQSRAEELTAEITGAIDSGAFEEAEDGITRLIALGAEESQVEGFRRSLEDARLYGSFEPGQTFQDTLEDSGEPGPRMVVIPAGSFMMGSPDSEPNRSNNEGPQHRVTFSRGFALSRTEVTVDQFRRFVEATGYVTDTERQGWSRIYDADSGRIDRRNGVDWRSNYMGERAAGDLPVIHVSWNDAKAYTDWLAAQTERSYRLPSEAEFEYALRAGSQTIYWWGDAEPSVQVENLTGDGDISTTRRRWTVSFDDYEDGHWGPAPVASFVTNPFGLYDMGGNVMEWVADCWHDSYVRAPADGEPWINPGCQRRVLRGSSWSSSPDMARSAFRLASAADGRDARVGFRVARDL